MGESVPVRASPDRPRRRARARRRLRWLALGALVVATLFYARPLRTYLDTRDTLARRSAQVEALRVEHDRLARRLARSESAVMLGREARRSGFVKPGERLFIVKGIVEWRRARRATMRGGG